MKKAMGQEELEELRARLDAIDRKLIDALAERQNAVADVARLKAGGSVAVRDAAREQDILTRLVQLGRAAGLDPFYVTRLFQEILGHSVRVQQETLAVREQAHGDERPLVVAYQGTDGAYSHLAAQRHFGARSVDCVYRGYDTFVAMLEAVRSGDADYAVLPIENTTAGSINEAYDLLARMDLALVGEEIQRVDHCLVALDAVPLSQIRRVYSHPQALAQCSDFLASLRGCQVEAFTDTAMAVKKVRDDQDLSEGAIASEEAARLYGLHVLKRGIANQKENYTRMVVVAAEPARYDARIACKTSLIFATRHEEGALVACLNTLAAHHLNLTKLESRPRPSTPWEYLFYVDFDGNLADANVQEAVRDLAANTSFLKVLGSYPSRTAREAKPAEPRPPRASAPTSVKEDVQGSPHARGGRRDSGGREAPGAKEHPGGVRAGGAGGPHITTKETPPPTPVEPDAQIRLDLDKKPYRLASRAGRSEDTVVKVGDALIGGPHRAVLAGPRLVESREAIRACARVVKEAGAHVLVAGCFGPRTSAYLVYDALEQLVEAGREVGLPVATEVLHPSDVAKAARKVDALVVGSRNMQSYALLEAVGKVDRPVILERGVMASIDEWLSAADTILSHGNQMVVLCERGIRTFETATRSTLDLSAIPVLRELTHLPVIVDPSPAVGVRRWILPMAEGAIASGAHGVLLEIHPEPALARDGAQQALTFEMFQQFMSRL